ncbi:MAG: hypothetical protein JNN13_18925 [Planctomycetes bacterium]|nr:hypothetical protein [Planctomycetota bacterium]
MRFLLFPAVALLMALPAKADKFWLSDPADPKVEPGSSPNVIEGVLLAENDDGYHVRVVGGELFLAKKGVFKVEKDSLSLDDIGKAEQQAAEANNAAEHERAAAEAAARRANQVRVAEASARKEAAKVDAAEAEPAPASGPAGYDPVVGRATGASQADLVRDAQVAWTLTKDRRYLKLLRQLRRMR